MVIIMTWLIRFSIDLLFFWIILIITDLSELQFLSIEIYNFRCTISISF